MADVPNVTSNDPDNETQPLSNVDETTTLPTSPAQGSPEPLYYITGEARVVRSHRRGSRTSQANPYPTVRTYHPACARRWDWLPTTLTTWRSEEEIQIPTDDMDISPYTLEPIHHTVPVLAARLHRHEGRLDDLEREQHVVQMYWLRQAHDRIAQLQRDQEDTTHTYEMIHQQVIDDRGATDLLQARLEECEQRSREAEEYSRTLEQRLTMAEENTRQAARLAETVDRLVILMSRVNLHRD